MIIRNTKKIKHIGLALIGSFIVPTILILIGKVAYKFGTFVFPCEVGKYNNSCNGAEMMTVAIMLFLITTIIGSIIYYFADEN